MMVLGCSLGKREAVPGRKGATGKAVMDEWHWAWWVEDQGHPMEGQLVQIKAFSSKIWLPLAMAERDLGNRLQGWCWCKTTK